MDKNLVLHRADGLFHVYGESMVERGKYAAFFKSIVTIFLRICREKYAFKLLYQ